MSRHSAFENGDCYLPHMNVRIRSSCRPEGKKLAGTGMCVRRILNVAVHLAILGVQLATPLKTPKIVKG